MLAFWSENVKAGAPVSMQPPEEYVLHISQVALTPEAQGIGTKQQEQLQFQQHRKGKTIFITFDYHIDLHLGRN